MLACLLHWSCMSEMSGETNAVSYSGSDHQQRAAAASRAHPLHPVLQHIAQSVRQNQKAIEVIDARTKKMERDYVSVNQQLKELISAIQKQERRQFSLKSAGFEVSYY